MSEEWISARDAREKVSPGWKQNGGPTDVICQRAGAGLVKTRARLFVTTKGGEEVKNGDHPIPPAFWSGGSLKQNWSQGDFSIWIHSDGWEIHWAAYGVVFERSGIEDMAPPPAVAENRARGGRPPKVDWEKVMIEMARQLHAGELIPDTQADIEKAIAEYLSGGDSLSESTIREHARPLWQAVRS